MENNAGLLLIASAQLFFALMNVAVKMLNSLDEPVPTLELVFVRMLITYMCCITYMLVMGVPDPWLGPKGVRLLLVTRGFSGFFGLFGVYFSLNYLSLSDTTVLTFLGPLTTAAAGALILKEKFTLREGIAGLFSLLGVVLIARPRFLFGSAPQAPDYGHVLEGGHGDPYERGTPTERVMAVGLSLLGVLGGTGAALCIRKIGRRAHAVHSLTSFSIYCVVASGLAMLWQRPHLVFPTRPEWILMLLFIGVVGFVAQTMVTLGLQRETVSRGSMGNYVQIIFATAFERFFFHTTPSALSIFGTLIIMTSAIYVLTKENTNIPAHRGVGLNNGEATLEEGLLRSADYDEHDEHELKERHEVGEYKEGKAES
ncbi:DUF6-domain-containing protein [Gloeophyllum trabeum ATCC 11539]|uniref:DUF6-domain-containing protein n=1 Tax=Gloeophyllum trabeum (strain ATCC 11539 / FP-39264 / Madison 617) TaxID=670483 RepID=S7Q193_GLOTA|nr:DUF6-domain-containing protein [Gloeophyllum trabeum ATCC 11539]EPQ53277.1 DUF6-domain-containing protein [Gloeophyllum trabeum ATCC 11539]